MTDLDLRLLVPRDIVLVGDDEKRTPIPGEVSVVESMEIERIRGDLWAAQREREAANSRDEEVAARAAIAAAYQEGADKIHALALTRNADAEAIDLTPTQIEAILAMLAAPAERETLMALAYSMAMGLEVPELDPLGDGSSSSSSPSDEPEASAGPTGKTSRGVRGSRSAGTRSKKP